ncbi:SDR family oxidoreductase [Puniceicoccus vermicola]|uniref:dTDP-4-dehydrorhamnose reductase n=1 Tax=Puniceicoccus vermicola TaxID=388746 RepID=A0A7X1B2P3_9BACT|nr:SDR family oxidoreductase [Puniceicoccus vermicola]MBC2603315.1 SDR family oxidoreductase [Puniceicoccus vermicola]
MKVFVFGASGLVGSAIARACVRRRIDTFTFVGSRGSGVSGVVSERSVDITDRETIERLILEEWPDVVINAAAVSSPGDVDQNPALAEKINVAFPRQLAMLTRHLGAQFIHFSTDMVFDGDVGGYRSTATPNPLSLYGQLKLMAEREILKFNDERPVVLRITIVNGNSVSGQRSVHEKLLGMVAAGEKPRLFTDEIRQPCSASNVAEVAVELAERNDLHGIFHWAGSDPVSRADLGRAVMRRFGLSEDHIEAVEAASLEGNSKRPANLTLELEPLAGKLKTQPASLAAQMEELQPPAHLYRWIRENGKL